MSTTLDHGRHIWLSNPPHNHGIPFDIAIWNKGVLFYLKKMFWKYNGLLNYMIQLHSLPHSSQSSEAFLSPEIPSHGPLAWTLHGFLSPKSLNKLIAHPSWSPWISSPSIWQLILVSVHQDWAARNGGQALTYIVWTTTDHGCKWRVSKVVISLAGGNFLHNLSQCPNHNPTSANSSGFSFLGVMLKYLRFRLILVWFFVVWRFKWLQFSDVVE